MKFVNPLGNFGSDLNPLVFYYIIYTYCSNADKPKIIFHRGWEAEGKEYVGKSKNIGRNIQEMGVRDEDWLNLAQDRTQMANICCCMMNL